MKVMIVGATGFVGANLTRLLVEGGHEVTMMARGVKPDMARSPRAGIMAADGMKPGAWQEKVPEHDAVINLAGVSVFARWNEAYKNLIRESRILTTRNVVDALPGASGNDISLINASGAGIYGDRGDERLDEDSSLGSDFLAGLAKDWEDEALRAKEKGVRVVRARIGIVLGRAGGALPQMTLPFKFFAGGPVGSGEHWVPWIHIEDLCRAFLFLMESREASGPFNFTAPEPVKNRDLSRAIGGALGRPSFLPAPAFMLKLVLGEFGSVVLESQRAIPKALLELGFKFRFPEINGALQDLLG
jgi:hypothetical protein